MFYHSFPPKTPSFVTLFITTKCNMSCRHCFVRGKSIRGDGDLSVDVVGKVIASLKGRAHIMLTGGEPFLSGEIEDIVSLLQRSDKVASILVCTNGALSGAINDFCLTLQKYIKKPTTLQLSLEGLGATHDSIRGYQGAFQQFEKTAGLVQKICSLQPLLRYMVNTTIAKHNIHELQSLIDYFKRAGFPFCIAALRGNEFSLFGLDGSLKEPDYNPQEGLIFDLSVAFKALDILRLNADSVGKGTLRLFRIFCDTLRRKKRAVNCCAGYQNAVIYANGDIGFCEQVKPFGNLAKWGWDVSAAWGSPEAKTLREGTRRCACIDGCVLDRSLHKHNVVR